MADIDPYHRIQKVTTPSGPLALVRPIAERLLKEGVISGTLDGALHAADAATVKAATMAAGICDFCSVPGIEHDFDVPDFDMPIMGRSTDGWAACGPCGALVKAGRRKELLARSVEGMSFGKFTKPAIQELHNRFWTAMDRMSEARGMAEALADFVADKLPDPPAWHTHFTGRASRLAALSKVTGLTMKELDLAVAGEVSSVIATKLLRWHKTIGQRVTPETLADLAGGHKPLAHVVPHWQQALDAKFGVLKTLHKLLAAVDIAERLTKSTDLNDRQGIEEMIQVAQAQRRLRELSIGDDYRCLLNAEVYSFNADTEAAILDAAAGIPHDAPLSSVETPNARAGWFWFSDPLVIAASPSASDKTHALLWAWVSNAPGVSEPALMFSAYVRDEKNEILPPEGVDHPFYPATRWHWPLSMSLSEMVAYNGKYWRATYGPGGPLEFDPHVGSEESMLKVVSSLSEFFAMACVWFRQTVPGQPKKHVEPVLTQTTGHVERHARKRYQRDFKLSDVPTVQIVALRKTARTERETPHERGEGTRVYECRWIVKGHPRLQACGPGRKDRKLIWIEAHPAGPEDKPLKSKMTVYAVVR